MAAETQYTAKTGMATISTANSNLDGTGAMGTVITASSSGTLIKTIIIKAQTNTSQGMIRLFIFNGTTTRLLTEIKVPAVTKSATEPSFEYESPFYINLKSDWSLKASTENAETFNIFAEAQDWTYYSASVRQETTIYTANTSGITISSANSNLDGTGTIETAFTSNGSNIFSISIKSQQNTSAGMIRLFLSDGSNTKLFKEIPVKAITKSSNRMAFQHKYRFDGLFALQDEWFIKASTEKSESFNIITEAFDWSYPA